MGLDLGQSQDYTALCVAERVDVPTGKAHYHLRHLERFRLGTSYPAVVERVGEMLAGPPLWKWAVGTVGSSLILPLLRRLT